MHVTTIAANTFVGLINIIIAIPLLGGCYNYDNTGERAIASGTSKAAGKSAASTSGEEMKALIRDTILEVLRDTALPTAAADHREPVAPST